MAISPRSADAGKGGIESVDLPIGAVDDLERIVTIVYKILNVGLITVM